MHIDVLQYTDGLAPELITNKIAVVIDVFRATSVITTALAHGAKEVIATRTIAEAQIEYAQRNKQNCILGGERNMQKIAGFHYGNSPQSYVQQEIANKTVILTTTNGTNAINYCISATEIYICSLLNCYFVAKELLKKSQDIVIICAGTRKSFSLEDAYCAGMLLTQFNKYMQFNTNDLGWIMKSFYTSTKDKPRNVLLNGTAYQALISQGFAQDIAFCLQKNIYNVIPRYVVGRIII